MSSSRERRVSDKTRDNPTSRRARFCANVQTDSLQLATATVTPNVRVCIVVTPPHRQHHAEQMIKIAHRRGTPVRDLSACRWTEQVARIYPSTDTDNRGQDAGPQRRPQQWRSQSILSLGATGDHRETFADDMEEEDDKRGPTHEGSHDLNLISECRDHSASSWLHFPHIELVFLFFAFEGAVAAEVSALRGSTCPWVIFMAVTALVSRLLNRRRLR